MDMFTVSTFYEVVCIADGLFVHFLVVAYTQDCHGNLVI